ncbi:MAG TPA: hypothetical protein VF611_08265 [Pyrinomonadaceae bacterium]
MRLTTKIILFSTAALVAYDLYAAASAEQGDTISEVIAKESRRRPIIAFGLGVIVGHWFWALESAGGDGKAKGAPDPQ